MDRLRSLFWNTEKYAVMYNIIFYSTGERNNNDNNNIILRTLHLTRLEQLN